MNPSQSPTCTPYLARQVVATGCPPFILNVVACITQALIYNSLKFYGGDREIAIMGVIFTLMMLTFMPMIGLNHGTQPIIGFNYGARNYGRVRHTAMLNLSISTAICILMYITINTFGKWMFMPFSSQQDFVTLGASILVFNWHNRS